MTKTTLRMPDDLYEEVERLAERDHRSVNQQLVHLIAFAAGYMTEDAKR
jgi:predicted transcriptional regulator